MMISAYKPYRSVTSNKELDLRQELHRTLYGAIDEVAKGKVGLLRRMRLDSNNEPIRCPCRSRATDEPDRDFYCRYCHGHGYYWDEYKIVYFKDDDPSKTQETETKEYETTMFWFEYGADITDDDFIVEVKLDKEGKPVLPVSRVKKYDILHATPFRSDNGRVEFWEIKAREDRKWSVWYDVQNRQHN